MHDVNFRQRLSSRIFVFHPKARHLFKRGVDVHRVDPSPSRSGLKLRLAGVTHCDATPSPQRGLPICPAFI
jgi:hypothetical protein